MVILRAKFNGLAEFKSHRFFTETQSYSPSGWESVGVDADLSEEDDETI